MHTNHGLTYPHGRTIAINRSPTLIWWMSWGNQPLANTEVVVACYHKMHFEDHATVFRAACIVTSTMTSTTRLLWQLVSCQDKQPASRMVPAVTPSTIQAVMCEPWCKLQYQPRGLYNGSHSNVYYGWYHDCYHGWCCNVNLTAWVA